MARLTPALPDSADAGGVEQSSGMAVLSAECKRIADELHAALQTLKARGSHKVWSSFQTALKEIWKKDHIDALTKQLEMLKTQLTVHLLSDLRFAPTLRLQHAAHQH